MFIHHYTMSRSKNDIDILSILKVITFKNIKLKKTQFNRHITYNSLKRTKAKRAHQNT